VSKTVLLATEKAFSASARDQVVAIIKEAGYTANVLENYKGKGPLIEAIASADAVIFRSDIIDTEVLDAAKNLKLAVRAGRLAYTSGRIPRKAYATASSPVEGMVGR